MNELLLLKVAFAKKWELQKIQSETIDEFFYYLEKSFFVLELLNFYHFDHFINFKFFDVITILANPCPFQFTNLPQKLIKN